MRFRISISIGMIFLILPDPPYGKSDALSCLRAFVVQRNGATDLCAVVSFIHPACS